MSGVLQSAGGKIFKAPRQTSDSLEQQATLIRVDQAMDKLTMLADELTSSPNAVLLASGLGDQAFATPSPDGRRTYVASTQSSSLVGFVTPNRNTEPVEFCRLRLGLQRGGISSVAVGGTWVFAACGEDNRIVVLRLCHDWYQNKTRLLVMRVVDGGKTPISIVTNKEGSKVGVLYSGESLLRTYRCSVNGKLELLEETTVPDTATGLYFDEATSTISAIDSLGVVG